MTYSVKYRGVVYDDVTLGDGATRADAVAYARFVDPTGTEAEIREHRDSDQKILDRWRLCDDL